MNPMVNAASLLMLAIAFPTMTLSQGFKAPLLDEKQGYQAPLRQLGGWSDGTACLIGTTCASCRNEATWWHTKTFTACGNEPKLLDGTKCMPGFSCRACKNNRSWWSDKKSYACGNQPTSKPTSSPSASPTSKPTSSPSASPTPAPTSKPTSSPSASPTSKPTSSPSASPTPAPTSKPTSSPSASPTPVPTSKPTSSPTSSPTYNLPLDSQCYSLGSSKEARDSVCAGDLVCARAGYDDRHYGGCHSAGEEIKAGPGLFGIHRHCCSKVPDDTFWADGKKCIGGSTAFSTCHKCKNQPSFWYSKMSNACGQEPQWSDGTICLAGTSCNRCKNKAKWVWRKASFVCGA